MKDRMPIITIPTIRKTTHDLSLAVAKDILAAGLSLDIEEYFLANPDEVRNALRRGFIIPEFEKPDQNTMKVTPPLTMMSMKKSIIPDLTNTGPTLEDWIKALEKLHHFLTDGETVDLLQMFNVSTSDRKRTDIMPWFRPAHATYRLAMEWKMKLGMPHPYEEMNVDQYTHAKGLGVPELHYINRSIEPDANTLGKSAKSSEGLIARPKTSWINLFGWSCADNLHFLVTRKHLDTGRTWTMFPTDKLPGDQKVGCGCTRDNQVFISSHVRNDRVESIGGRITTSIPLRIQT